MMYLPSFEELKKMTFDPKPKLCGESRMPNKENEWINIVVSIISSAREGKETALLSTGVGGENYPKFKENEFQLKRLGYNIERESGYVGATWINLK